MRWLKRTKEPEIHDHGRYLYKPIISRALHMIAGYPANSLSSLLDKGNVILNGERLVSSRLEDRLAPGRYILIDGNKTWKFYIL